MKTVSPTPNQKHINSYIQGNGNALPKIIKEYEKPLYAYIFYKIKNSELAEDFLQDTFVKAIQNIKKGNYKEEGKFYPWLKMIAHNLIVDYYRKSNRMRMVRDTEDYDMINAIPYEDYSEEYEDKQLEIKKLKSHIYELPISQREVVLMRLNQKMSFKEIAQKKRISINTVLGRMRYATMSLRKKLNGEQQAVA